MHEVLNDGIYLTESGLETTLIYSDGMDLPCFASFVLLREEAGRRRLEDFFRMHMQIAVEHRANIILDSVGWRASADWGSKLGIGQEELDSLNTQSIRMLQALREDLECPSTRMIVSGSVGPRGDAYESSSEVMEVSAAAAYHQQQIATYSTAGVDMVTAYTLTNAQEALGIVLAAKQAEVPVAVSFTVDTSGFLPSGQALADAIAFVDEGSQQYANHFRINCSHPVHVLAALRAGNGSSGWRQRVKGIKANASKRSHAELDQSTSLDAGDPGELAELLRMLREEFPWMNVLGGCCGTDQRHMRAIADKCV